MRIFTPLVSTLILVGSSPPAWAAPCTEARDLTTAIECVKSNEPAYRSASQSDKEASELKSSAFRLINPQLEVEVSDGTNLGNVEREKTASLLFTFELGGKRSARGKIFEAEGLNLKADAFEQQIQALTELGAAVLRLDQLQSEKKVVQESIGAFRRVIGLYRSRGALPPEQRVSLHTFELVLLGYERKLIDIESTLLQYQKRVESLFGPKSVGVPFKIEQWGFDLAKLRSTFDQWVENTPEMLRIRSTNLQADGQADMASADVWPNLQVGPSISQVTEGPTNYMMYGLRATIPLPVLSWNGAERASRNLTASRIKARLPWNRSDIRSQYESLLNKMERIRSLLKESPGYDDIQKKHASTENLYQRGMITGALMIEAHRGLVENYEAKHELQMDYLKGLLTLQHLERSIQ